MKKIIKAALATTVLASAFAIAAPAYAEDDAGPITVSGSATIATQYSLRGISQTDNDAAIQGGITIGHESGLYVSTWASNLAGYGDFGGSHMELDLIAGYSKDIGGVSLDGGFVYYAYPGVSGADFWELYGSVSGDLGPANLKLGTYWTPKQDSLGGHNIWVYSDLGIAIPNTPITLKGHVGYSDGTTGYTQGGDVFDYSFGADIAWKALTLNVSFVGTDIGTARGNAFWGGGAASGHDITKGRVVASLTAAF
ncbi:MAG: TorF family putative porin [Alphaproteobacteria bacterium]|nr:TorF family putative porin [Alphaproteobacteria bacterium]